jgi:hypothetical protein
MTTDFCKAFEKTKALELQKFPETGYYINEGDWEKLSPPDKLASEYSNPVVVEGDPTEADLKEQRGALDHYG